MGYRSHTGRDTFEGAFLTYWLRGGDVTSLFLYFYGAIPLESALHCILLFVLFVHGACLIGTKVHPDLVKG